MKKIFAILSTGMILVLAGCQNSPAGEAPGKQTAGMANPASVYCIEKGGKLEMRTNANGEYGVCLFGDNRQCEEWAFFRGECPDSIDQNPNTGNIVGGDRDEHGCIGSAGYSWCQEKQKCLRIWEESCEKNSGSSTCELENCHGLDIKCGSNPPDVCTEIYMLGDKCLQYAKCGIQNGTCQQIQNAQFTQCKSCIQACIDSNGNDNMKAFECESNCN